MWNSPVSSPSPQPSPRQDGEHLAAQSKGAVLSVSGTRPERKDFSAIANGESESATNRRSNEKDCGGQGDSHCQTKHEYFCEGTHKAPLLDFWSDAQQFPSRRLQAFEHDRGEAFHEFVGKFVIGFAFFA